MEYKQITLNDWLEMKQKLQKELLGVRQSFVRIGYTLRKIEEGKLYERDGYKSVAEFAKEVCGLGATAVTRFMQINQQYSVDGYSEALAPEYEAYNRSLLEEMLKLPEQDREMVTPQADRESVRELKRFNNAQPTGSGSMEELIEEFFKANRDVLNELYSNGMDGMIEDYRIRQWSEIVNPSGSKTFRKGTIFLMMYENHIMVKKINENPKKMEWKEFFDVTQMIFRKSEAGDRTYQNHFGEEETPKTLNAEDVLEGKKEEKQDSQSLKTEKAPIQPQKEIAPAQKKTENTECEADFTEGKKQVKTEGKTEHQTESVQQSEESEQIPGQIDIVKDMKECCPDAMNKQGMQENAKSGEDYAEKPEKEKNKEEEIKPKYGSRKQYLDSLTVYGSALYMAESMQGMKHMLLDNTEYWEAWLSEEVDDNGKEMESAE